MTSPSTATYPTPSRLFGEYVADPVRLVIVGIVLLALGYGVRAGNLSPIIIPFLEPFGGMPISAIDVLLASAVALEVVRRLMTGDYWLQRSPVSGWMLAFGLVCGAYPLVGMFIVEGGFRLPLEMLFLPMFVALFFVYLFLFRPSELPSMTWMIILAGVYKVFEGVVIYVTAGIDWGLLTGWRDGLLIAMMVMAGVLALVIKPGEDTTYARMRPVLIWALPFAVLVFLGSMRRSFIVGIVVSLPVIILLLRGAERRRAMIAGFIAVAASAAMLPFISLGIEDRLEAVADPTAEGSSAYRLLELYNISSMIAERPLTGWPMATTWENRTGVSIEIVSSILPHNIYLYTLWRAGVWGLLAYVGLLVALARMHRRTVKAARTPFERFLALWLTSATVSIIVAGFACPVVTDRLQLFLGFPLVMASFLPGAWKTPARLGS